MRYICSVYGDNFIIIDSDPECAARKALEEYRKLQKIDLDISHKIFVSDENKVKRTLDIMIRKEKVYSLKFEEYFFNSMDVTAINPLEACAIGLSWLTREKYFDEFEKQTITATDPEGKSTTYVFGTFGPRTEEEDIIPPEPFERRLENLSSEESEENENV